MELALRAERALLDSWSALTARFERELAVVLQVLERLAVLVLQERQPVLRRGRALLRASARLLLLTEHGRRRGLLGHLLLEDLRCLFLVGLR